MQSCFGESAEQPLRQRPSFQPNSLEVVGEVLQYRQQQVRFARHLYFPNDLARIQREFFALRPICDIIAQVLL
jgi:hypothetical protein